MFWPSSIRAEVQKYGGIVIKFHPIEIEKRKATLMNLTIRHGNDYCDSFIYQDGQLQPILTAEGRAVMEKLCNDSWGFGFYISEIC